MKASILAVLFAAAAVAAHAAPLVIKNPQWAQRPSPQQIVDLLPNAAAGDRAHLTCAVNGDGDVGDCKVVTADTRASNPTANFQINVNAPRLAQYYRLQLPDGGFSDAQIDEGVSVDILITVPRL